jgi:hypothetical protein
MSCLSSHFKCGTSCKLIQLISLNFTGMDNFLMTLKINFPEWYPMLGRKLILACKGSERAPGANSRIGPQTRRVGEGSRVVGWLCWSGALKAHHHEPPINGVGSDLKEVRAVVAREEADDSVAMEATDTSLGRSTEALGMAARWRRQPQLLHDKQGWE